MKNSILLLAFTLIVFAGFTYPEEKLLAPDVFAKTISEGKSKVYIFNVGPTPRIPGAVMIGTTEDPANRERLKAQVKLLPKEANVVVYCGCCKLEDCWNIHEADKVVSAFGFAQYKILNLPTDFYKDWKDKGYPVGQ
jgi:thiosulfate/3-mercaptopyruvate sulfurtransferase